MAKLNRTKLIAQTDALIEQIGSLKSDLSNELRQLPKILDGSKHLPGKVHTLDEYLAHLDSMIEGRLSDITAVFQGWHKACGSAVEKK